MPLSHEEFAAQANQGGASRSFKSGEEPSGPGVMVSIPGAEKITAAPTTAKEVEDFHTEHSKNAGDNMYQGAWKSGNTIFHDVSKKERTIEASRKAGVSGKQISGYDLGGTDSRRPSGGLIYYNRGLPGHETNPEFTSGENYTSEQERMEPKPKSQEFAEQAHISRGATVGKRGKKGTKPISINEVYATIAKNRRNRGV